MLPPLRLSSALISLALGATASAQGLNVDIGLNTVFPIPSSSYGAGAAQPGTWNGVSAPASSPVSLLGLTGSPSGVTLSSTGGSGNFAQDNGSTNGDDDSLMDDCESLDPFGSSTSTWTFQGLANGQYDVFTYAWAPDNDGYRTDVSVAGSGDPLQTVGGAWPGNHALGVTYALHDVTVTSGTISITLTISSDFGSLNGFQVKPAAGSPFTPNCFGDGTVAPCPCGNSGGASRGCQNSAGTGGAHLVGSGNPSISTDTVVLTASGELPISLTVFLQGDVTASPVNFGDGLRCAGGNLKHLFAKSASGGVVTAPGAGDPTISARSAAMGSTILPGQTRYYLTHYRDASSSFCPAPTGSTFNSSNGLAILWN